MARQPLACGALVLLQAVLAACSGYSTERLTAFPTARSIAVVPFANVGFRRDLELRLSQAVAREIRARTDLALATPASADLVMTGSMRADEVQTALDGQGTPIEKQLSGWLEIVVTDRRTGQVVRRRRVAATSEWRVGASGESLGGSATEDWIRRVAEGAVQALERNF